MEAYLIVVLILAVLVGVSLGLLGGGGSILTVPLLTYVAGMDPREAISASLFIVGVTSLVGMLSHARRGNVRWRTGLVFGGASMVGAFGAGLVGGYLPGTVLMIAFALMMLTSAAAMICRKGTARPRRTDMAAGRAVLDGFVVGAITGLVGAGGGFLVVPALVLLGGLAMPAAVGTSLLVITMKSFAGLGGYLTTVSLDWALVGAVTAAAVAGSFLGTALTGKVPEGLLRRLFGFFVLGMGVLVLALELPAPGGAVVVLAAALVTVVALGGRAVGAHRRRTSTRLRNPEPIHHP
ncbi:sulfite exporter TauE/SafE family protein [Pseudactinotalea sp. Z1732]|uniref:sulfite exporter TauE/SafE family protein n=1 Tax=Pseudactinotalea sp. Z1732 TaxID=3413026 RepID=UPI003C7E92DA